MNGIGERSIATVLRDIVGNVQQIIRAEIRLAKVEIGREVSKVRRSVTLLLIGGVISAMSLGFVLLAGVDALSLVVAPWMAALIVGAAAAGIGAIFIAIGMTQMQQVAVPPRTMATIEENLQWTKAPTR